jgi:hypothetical protein
VTPGTHRRDCSHGAAAFLVGGRLRLGWLSREELGLALRETFVPQAYAWGGEAQVDWYEAVAEIGGERQQVYNFAMRSCPPLLSAIACCRASLLRRTPAA